MSAAAAAPRPGAVPVEAIARPSLARLAGVELRKMVDTRAGFWLAFTFVLTTLAAVVLVCLVGDDSDRRLRELLEVAIAPASVLLPVVGILLVTSEWTQRTGMIAFTLVPRRPRVFAAKLLAGVAMALIAFVACMIVAAVATALAGSGGEHTWTLPVVVLAQALLSVIVSILAGIGFGAVVLTSAPAIVAYFVLPTVLGAVGSIRALEPTARWVDPSRAQAPLTDHVMDATEWARALTSIAIWALLPIVLGLWRIVRSDVR
jgi:ABC-2 type transport system permease protein